MFLLVIAWGYVVLMMAVVEASSASGTLLGALFTLLLYGVLPLGIVVYLMRTPARAKARRQRAALEDSVAADPDRGSHPATDPVAAEREKT